eukprot:TRINITY_DN40981_c0_g1_i1.p1 TRINITY_DN40981_c0_g1~~TRINITY_DN40981_c0_g1_i1.p1  ORF type:complete len:719 (-),score=98.98 TRINITY_DN40981_c0_g1_i1:90-2246(-)
MAVTKKASSPRASPRETIEGEANVETVPREQSPAPLGGIKREPPGSPLREGADEGNQGTSRCKEEPKTARSAGLSTTTTVKQEPSVEGEGPGEIEKEQLRKEGDKRARHEHQKKGDGGGGDTRHRRNTMGSHNLKMEPRDSGQAPELAEVPCAKDFWLLPSTRANRVAFLDGEGPLGLRLRERFTETPTLQQSSPRQAFWLMPSTLANRVVMTMAESSDGRSSSASCQPVAKKRKTESGVAKGEGARGEGSSAHCDPVFGSQDPRAASPISGSGRSGRRVSSTTQQDRRSGGGASGLQGDSNAPQTRQTFSSRGRSSAGGHQRGRGMLPGYVAVAVLRHRASMEQGEQPVRRGKGRPRKVDDLGQRSTSSKLATHKKSTEAVRNVKKPGPSKCRESISREGKLIDSRTDIMDQLKDKIAAAVAEVKGLAGVERSKASKVAVAKRPAGLLDTFRTDVTAFAKVGARGGGAPHRGADRSEVAAEGARGIHARKEQPQKEDLSIEGGWPLGLRTVLRHREAAEDAKARRGQPGRPGRRGRGRGGHNDEARGRGGFGRAGGGRRSGVGRGAGRRTGFGAGKMHKSKSYGAAASGGGSRLAPPKPLHDRSATTDGHFTASTSPLTKACKQPPSCESNGEPSRKHRRKTTSSVKQDFGSVQKPLGEVAAKVAGSGKAISKAKLPTVSAASSAKERGIPEGSQRRPPAPGRSSDSGLLRRPSASA